MRFAPGDDDIGPSTQQHQFQWQQIATRSARSLKNSNAHERERGGAARSPALAARYMPGQTHYGRGERARAVLVHL